MRNAHSCWWLVTRRFCSLQTILLKVDFWGRGEIRQDPIFHKVCAVCRMSPTSSLNRLSCRSACKSLHYRIPTPLSVKSTSLHRLLLCRIPFPKFGSHPLREVWDPKSPPKNSKYQRHTAFIRTFSKSSRELLPSSLKHESGTQQKLFRWTFLFWVDIFPGGFSSCDCPLTQNLITAPWDFFSEFCMDSAHSNL